MSFKNKYRVRCFDEVGTMTYLFTLLLTSDLKCLRPGKASELHEFLTNRLRGGPDHFYPSARHQILGFFLFFCMPFIIPLELFPQGSCSLFKLKTSRIFSCLEMTLWDRPDSCVWGSCEAVYAKWLFRIETGDWHEKRSKFGLNPGSSAISSHIVSLDLHFFTFKARGN